MALSKVLSPVVKVVVPVLIASVVLVFLLIPPPEVHMSPLLDLELFTTCGERRLEAGYVLALKNWEQQTSGSANLMSLQCWAATLKMVVVEYFMATSLYKVPDELLENPSITTSNTFVRLRQLYDIDYWNQYSRSKCYAPLVKWEEFLCNAPREVILVHIAYATVNSKDKLQGCPPKQEYTDMFTQQYSPFLETHGFRIIREVCIEMKKQILSTRAFNDFIMGKRKSNVTVMINAWRGTMRWKGERVTMTDTRCFRNNFLSLQFTRPSTILLEHVRLYQEQVLKNKDYIAVMVRLELAVKAYFRRRASSPSQCMKGISSIWRGLTKSNNLEETFWSFDVGTYGSVGYSRWGIGGGYEHVSNDLFTYMEKQHNVLYPAIEEALSNVSGTTNDGYIASLQLNIAVQAKCLILIGGGAFHDHASNMYTSRHKGTPCIVKKDVLWLINQCRM